MSLSGWLLLLAFVAAVGWYAAQRRRPKVPAHTAPRVPTGPDDLGSLGLSEVRPAQPRREGDGPEGDGPEDSPRRSGPSEASPAAAPRPARAPHLGTVSEARPLASDPAETAGGPAVSHLLASLAAHAGGPVALVRHDGERFRVEARTDGGPLTPVRGAPLRLDAPADLGRGALGGLAALVDGRAHAAPLGDERVVLIGGDADLAAPYLRLLAALTASASPAEPAAPDDAGAVATGPAPVPRAAIIAEEQAAARAGGRPLAFALVTLADAEDRLTDDPPEAVAMAEADLRNRLELAEATRRVEPFGDLLFGAFLDLDAGGTAGWCDALASGDPPLFIGAVAPADGDPAAVRDAAAEALRDAYDQQRTRIVEV